jgi:hypothetical protein
MNTFSELVVNSCFLTFRLPVPSLAREALEFVKLGPSQAPESLLMNLFQTPMTESLP